MACLLCVNLNLFAIICFKLINRLSAKGTDGVMKLWCNFR